MLKELKKYFLLSFVLLLLGLSVSRAGDPVVYDSVGVKPAQMDPAIEKKIFEDEAYQYKEEKVSSNFVGDFFRWLIKNIFGDVSSKSIDAFWSIVKIIFIVLFVGGIIYLIIKNNAVSLFRGESSKTGIFEDVTENIEELDIDKLIAEALNKNDYKTAFRYSFLKMLQKLNSKDYIEWKPFKTNYEYYLELKPQEIKSSFRELYMGFEYVWYGDAPINSQVYENYRADFNKINSKIGA